MKNKSVYKIYIMRYTKINVKHGGISAFNKNDFLLVLKCVVKVRHSVAYHWLDDFTKFLQCTKTVMHFDTAGEKRAHKSHTKDNRHGIYDTRHKIILKIIIHTFDRNVTK